jgi:hypothetical protein
MYLGLAWKYKTCVEVTEVKSFIAYYNAELITTTKSFRAEAFRAYPSAAL